MDQIAPDPAGDDSRARIIAAAKNAFAAAGFQGASTRGIADKAGVAQSLLLYHYGSKEELWKAVLDDSFARLSALIDPLLHNPDQSMTEMATGIIRAFVQVCDEDPDLHRLMTIESRGHTSRLAWLTDTHLRTYFNFFTDLIAEGQKQGLAKPGDPVLLFYSAISIAGTIYAHTPEIAIVTGREVKPRREDVEVLIRRLILIDE